MESVLVCRADTNVLLKEKKMERHQRANMLQQFFVILKGVNQSGAVHYQGSTLVVNLDEVRPYNLFCSILNALGEDPLPPLSQIQKLLDEFREVFRVADIIFQVQEHTDIYKQVPIEDDKQPWITFGGQAAAVSVLPEFKHVIWQVMTSVPTTH